MVTVNISNYANWDAGEEPQKTHPPALKLRRTWKTPKGKILTASSESNEQQAAEQAARNAVTGNCANYANCFETETRGQKKAVGLRVGWSWFS